MSWLTAPSENLGHSCVKQEKHKGDGWKSLYSVKARELQPIQIYEVFTREQIK